MYSSLCLTLNNLEYLLKLLKWMPHVVIDAIRNYAHTFDSYDSSTISLFLKCVTLNKSLKLCVPASPCRSNVDKGIIHDIIRTKLLWLLIWEDVYAFLFCWGYYMSLGSHSTSVWKCMSLLHFKNKKNLFYELRINW